MKLGIDASNLLSGGGVTHLEELLHAADPDRDGFSEVVVWGRASTIERLPSKPWLRAVRDPELEGNLVSRTLWRMRRLDSLAREAKCDILFVPGGTYLGRFRPFVTMSRNLLPFDSAAVRHYGISWMRLKMTLLRISQTATFKSASGVIFLTTTARDYVTRVTGDLSGQTDVIPHGISSRFSRQPATQLAMDAYSHARPFRLLYVSNLEPYKHHATLVAAISGLRRDGYPITLDLVGAGGRSALQDLEKMMSEDPASRAGVTYHGAASYSELPRRYHEADAFVFASSCENLPNILLEAMLAGLPIACSNRSVMPEVLGGAGVYFDPESTDSTTQAILTLFKDAGLRGQIAAAARQRVTDWSWARCAERTFSFLGSVRAGEGRSRVRV